MNKIQRKTKEFYNVGRLLRYSGASVVLQSRNIITELLPDGCATLRQQLREYVV